MLVVRNELKSESNSSDRTSGTPPRDACYINRISLICIGVLMVLPFSIISTAREYWFYKFRNTTDAILDPKERTDMQTHFASLLTICSQTSSTIFLGLATLSGFLLKPKTCIVATSSFCLCLFIIMASFITINTNKWQTGFFITTLGLATTISATSSISTVNVYGILVCLPHKYIEYYLIGHSISGALAAVMQIFALAIGTTPVSSALVYFWTCNGFIIVTICCFVIATYSEFYQFYLGNLHIVRRTKYMRPKEICHICRDIWTSLVIMGMVIMTYVPVYPSVAYLIESETHGNIWGDKFFAPVTIFLIPTISDIIGKLIAFKLKLRISGIAYVMFSATRMVILPPAIMLCNAYPRKKFPIWFPHDWHYVTFGIIFGMTHGYLVIIAFTNVLKLAGPGKKVEAYSILSTSNGVLFIIAAFLSQVCVRIL